MIGSASHPFQSSHRLVPPSTRRMAQALMHVELHGRRMPGLVGSLLILAVIALFVLGLLWGPLNAAARLF